MAAAMVMAAVEVAKAPTVTADAAVETDEVVQPAAPPELPPSIPGRPPGLGPPAEPESDALGNELATASAPPTAPMALICPTDEDLAPAPLTPAQIRASESMLQAVRAKSGQANWQKMHAARAKLPAASKRAHVLEALRTSSVLVVSGETGCGKTTQVPQFILDDAIENGNGGAVSIICTQPRRIAAISVADWD